MKAFIVCVTLACLFALVFAMCDFCRTSSGTQCGRSDNDGRSVVEEEMEASTTLSINEDEEEVLSEEVTVLGGGSKGSNKEQSGKGGFEKGKDEGPNDLKKLPYAYEVRVLWLGHLPKYF